MKKVAGVGVCLIAVGVGWYLFQGSAQESPVQQAKPASMESMRIDKSKTVEPLLIEESLSENDGVATAQKEPSYSECMKENYKDPKWKGIYLRIENLGLGGDVAAGQGAFQRLPLESLKSYANANDKGAMYLYGVELSWKAINGFYYTSNYREYDVGSPEFKKAIKEHTVDSEKLNKGQGYLYQAALRGKFFGLLEIASNYSSVARKLKKQGVSEEILKDRVAKSYSHVLLLKKILEQDSFLYEMAGGEKSLDWSIRDVFDESQNLEELKEEILEKSKRAFSELQERWESDRQYLGFNPYPNIITVEEERFFQEKEDFCNQYERRF